MLDTEKPFVKSMLDTLADMLHVTRIEEWQKDEYFDALKKYSYQRFVAGVKNLQETYEPKRITDFPVLKVLHEFCGAVRIPEEEQQSRDQAEIEDSFTRRGLIVGDEAKRRMEDDIIARMEAHTGERIDNRQYFLNGPKGSPDPSKLKLKPQVQAEAAAAETPQERFEIALRGLALGYGRWSLEPSELKAYRELLDRYSSEQLLRACWKLWGEKGRRTFPTVHEFRELIHTDSTPAGV